MSNNRINSAEKDMPKMLITIILSTTYISPVFQLIKLVSTLKNIEKTDKNTILNCFLSLLKLT